MIRVIIADDQGLVRGGFASILSTQDDIEVVGEAADGARAVDLCRRLQPDVEIGRQLCLAEATVKTHVTHVLAKLGLRDRLQAVVYAYESGLVRPSGQFTRRG